MGEEEEIDQRRGILGRGWEGRREVLGSKRRTEEERMRKRRRESIV